jgi:hypothetical protein
VLRYLARYTHRIAISNRRLVALDDNRVTFKWKDYRIEGPERYKLMTLDTHEFIRRFLMHVLPQGFHRIRYYGWLTSQTRVKNIARIRELLAVPLIPIDAIKAVNAKPKSQKRQSILVPAAAATCASSRPSCAGNSRSTVPRQRSGSTPHDADASPRHTRQHSPPVLALARQRRRLPRHAGLLRNHTQKTQNLVAQNARCSIVLQPTFRLRGKTGLAAASRHRRRT